jgi:hypothetical protein
MTSVDKAQPESCLFSFRVGINELTEVTGFDEREDLLVLIGVVDAGDAESIKVSVCVEAGASTSFRLPTSLHKTSREFGAPRFKIVM